MALNPINKAKLLYELSLIDNINVFNVNGIGCEFIYIADAIQVLQKDNTTFKLVSAIDVTHFCANIGNDFQIKFKEYLKNVEPFAMNMDFYNYSYTVIRKK